MLTLFHVIDLFVYKLTRLCRRRFTLTRILSRPLRNFFLRHFPPRKWALQSNDRNE
jgi:hypothetical protein